MRMVAFPSARLPARHTFLTREDSIWQSRQMKSPMSKYFAQIS